MSRIKSSQTFSLCQFSIIAHQPGYCWVLTLWKKSKTSKKELYHFLYDNYGFSYEDLLFIVDRFVMGVKRLEKWAWWRKIQSENPQAS